MKKNEVIVNVPLTKAEKDLLKKRADSNNRSMGREAASIVKRSLSK